MADIQPARPAPRGVLGGLGCLDCLGGLGPEVGGPPPFPAAFLSRFMADLLFGPDGDVTVCDGAAAGATAGPLANMDIASRSNTTARRVSSAVAECTSS